MKDRVVAFSYSARDALTKEVLEAPPPGNSMVVVLGKAPVRPAIAKLLREATPGQKYLALLSVDELFGPRDEANKINVLRFLIPPHWDLAVGTQHRVERQNGELLFLKVKSVGLLHVEFDTNHPLAGSGKTLEFEYEVLGIGDPDVRAPTFAMESARA